MQAKADQNIDRAHACLFIEERLVRQGQIPARSLIVEIAQGLGRTS